MKFPENPLSGSLIVTCGWTEGWTDTHDEAKSRCIQFCECAQNV